MSRYGKIELITEAEAQQNPALLTAKMSWIGHLIVGLFFLGWSVGFPLFLLNNGLFTADGGLFGLLFAGFIWVFCSVIVLTCVLAGLVFLFSALAAMKTSNWTLRAAPEGIYLKLRNYGDHRLSAADPIVAFIPKREIRRLKFVGQKTRMVADADVPEDNQTYKEESLEIALYGEDLSLIEHAFEEEHLRKGPTWIKGVTTRAKGAALRLFPESGVIRVDWKTRKTHLTPSVKTAMAVLGGLYDTETEEAAEEAPLVTLSKEAQEERLREMVRRGDAIGATALVRETQGLTLTQAHQYLKSL
ncbi:MAG: hypothetical protein CMN56_09270 [Sneathiella sp.]|uniref:hypothetical protein n=1 Tax=Sneathiella sp. TaxID=1964365 RepID=UPI000C6BCE86|nr:hypothetical protein [Sneathiella sp.]MAZ03315.1 hypothetical protein [Sneathiella sp.]